VPRSRPAPAIPFDPSIDDWPDASAAATQCFLNLGYLFVRVEMHVQALMRGHNIPSTTAFNILTILDGAGEALPPSVVAERMVITRGTVTSVVDSLVRHGLVARELDKADGRVRRVSLTDEVRRRARAARGDLHRFEHRLLGVLGAAELQRLLGTVARLQESVAELAGQQGSTSA
jgi:DNA-binding MarR family transcriptional regulator